MNGPHESRERMNGAEPSALERMEGRRVLYAVSDKQVDWMDKRCGVGVRNRNAASCLTLQITLALENAVYRSTSAPLLFSSPGPVIYCHLCFLGEADIERWDGRSDVHPTHYQARRTKTNQDAGMLGVPGYSHAILAKIWNRYYESYQGYPFSLNVHRRQRRQHTTRKQHRYSEIIRDRARMMKDILQGSLFGPASRRGV